MTALFCSLSRSSATNMPQVDPNYLRNEIADIDQKIQQIIGITAWPCVEQARKASEFAKGGALLQSVKLLQLAQHYGATDEHKAEGESCLDQALEILQTYSNYTLEQKNINFSNWFEISTAHFLRLKSLLMRNYDPEEKKALARKGLHAIDQALVIDPTSSQAIFRKFLFLQLLEESGEHSTEDPTLWYEKFLASHPDPDSEDYVHYAQLYGGELAKKGRVEKALAWFESLIKQKKPNPITFMYLAKVQNQMNTNASALESMKNACRLAPDNLEIRIWYFKVKVQDQLCRFKEMNCLPKQDEIEEWVATCNEFCALFSENCEKLVGTTSISLTMKELAQNIYLTQLPEMANILAHLQQFEFALALYENILANTRLYLTHNFFDQSEIVKLFTAVGGIYLKMENYEEAEKHLLQAISLDESYLASYENLVAVYASQQNEAQLDNLWSQLELLGILEGQQEKTESVLFNFGTAYLLLVKDASDPRLEKAKSFYERSLKQDPDCIDSKIMLARVLVISGGQQHWELARELLMRKEEDNQPFEKAPFVIFQYYFCLASLHALCKNIPEAKKAAIAAGKTRVDPGQVRVLQSYLENFNTVEFGAFCEQITESIKKVEFSYRIGRLINPRAVIFDACSYIGYHGTIDRHANSIRNEIIPSGATNRQFEGKGFYIAEDREIASYFAFRKAMEEGGRPVLVKIYSKSGLVGREVSPRFKVKKEATQYDFIKSKIDGYEAYHQHYVFEDSLEKLRASEELEPVTWTEEEFQAFLKKWSRSMC